MQYVIIGAGSRGMTYGLWSKENNIKIAAIAECRPERLKSAGQNLGVPENMLFENVQQLFALGKIADAAIIATMDRDHYSHVMQALDCGYDILLEKPISPDPKECLEIEEKARLDGYYVENLSFGLDVKCFLGTVKSVLNREGVVEGGTGAKKAG